MKTRRHIRMGKDFFRQFEEFTQNGWNYTITWRSNAGNVYDAIYSPELGAMINLSPEEVYKHYLRFHREKVRFYFKKRENGVRPKGTYTGYLINVFATIERTQGNGKNS